MSKRLFDFIASIVALLAFSPLLLFIAFCVRVFIGAPVFFTQQRAGQFGRSFEIIKFRTMTDTGNTEGVLLPDEVRLNRFGRMLRASSLDELPELWNVLKGEMSLVGPRPLLMEYLPKYSSFQARRHEVRPGITGWAQVKGRNSLSWEEKFELDVWYVDNRSFWLDLYILLVTVYRVLRREGISAPNSATMPKFKGSVNS
jgi:sugar transferase EpsL